MRQLGVQGARRGKKVRTIVSDTKAPCPLDRVNRVFKAERPNQLWVSDFMYVSTWQGWLYGAFVIDVYARRIVGWRVSSPANDFRHHLPVIRFQGIGHFPCCVMAQGLRAGFAEL